MPVERAVEKLVQAQPTIEGAGVRLNRVFGFGAENLFDPFLLLDDFRGDRPEDYLAGFPWHPHRGIETITYMLTGSVEHGDSMGNRGVIGPGEVQWMTAGSGIIHQEMPRPEENGPRMGGFQLWANLPAADKMMDPRYQEVKSSQIPEVVTEGGVRVRVICGEFQGVRGPVQGIVTDPAYLDVTLPAWGTFEQSISADHTVFAYLFEGQAMFGADAQPLQNRQLALFGPGELVKVTADGSLARFLLVSGKPIREPVAWYGPIVMNTQAELNLAMKEYRNGTFIKKGNQG